MRQRIKLKTHDGSKNSLVFNKYENGFYLFHLVSEFNNIRIIGPSNNIQAIDPSGGPMLCVGDDKIIPGFVLKKIGCMSKNPLTLYFKSINNDTRRT